MRLKNLCALTLLISFALLMLGPLIQLDQGHQLVCQDWPLCFGQVFPGEELQGRGWLEYSHRFLAAFVGFLSALLVLLAYQKRDRDEAGRAALKPLAMALFFVVIQGLLGGLTVVYQLPTLISTAHMFFSLVYILFLEKAYVELSFSPELLVSGESKVAFQKMWRPGFRDALWVGLTLILTTMLLNSLVRQTDSLRVCGTGIDALWSCQQFGGLSPFSPDAIPSAKLHMSYRFWAFLSFVVAFISSGLMAWRLRKAAPRLSAFSCAVSFLIFISFLMGPLVLATRLSLGPTLWYLALNLLALSGFWVLYLSVIKLEQHFFQRPLHTFFSDLMELTKPRLSALVMVTALVGMLVAPVQISLFKSAWALLLIAFVVMGACALNCYIEMEVDKKMDRTKERALPSGRMHSKTALGFGLGLLLVSVPLLAWSINMITALLALVAALLYLLAYTPLKRKSELALYVGAIPGALPPMMGWTAVTNDLSPMAWSLFLIMFVWQLPHFLAISIFHAQDYARAGIKIYPNQRGEKRTKTNILLGTLWLFAVSLTPSFWGHLGTAYQLAALIFGAAFTLLAFAGFFLDKSDVLGLRLWARRYFLGSLFYLPLLMGSMIFFR